MILVSRRRNLLKLLIFIFLCQLTDVYPIPLFEDLPHAFHPVTTQNSDAQRFFDQGLTFLYAFNHEAAYHSFEQAAKIDPQLAMAYWGMALALGPVFGTDIPANQEKKAYELAQKSLQLSSHATVYEQVYIQALSKKYSPNPHADVKELARHYRDSMQKVMQHNLDDLDAAVLFAKSSMDLNVDNLWKTNGEPNAGTLDIVSILESVLKRDPQHIGANHFYIHTMESSAYPERALMSAGRLAEVNPILTHLVHTPSHIYLPVGDYQASIRVNEKSVAAARDYIQKYGGEGATDKLSHLLLYLTRSYTMAGRLSDAKRSAHELKAVYENSGLQDIHSSMEFDYSTLLLVLIRFHAWQEILAEPPPLSKMKVAVTLWHLARAIAYASLGQEGLARQEQALAKKDLGNMDEQERKSIEILHLLLEAKLSELKEQILLAMQFFHRAIAIQDSLIESPLDWLLIIRENLGYLLLRNQQLREAEMVFRQDLDRHPRNGRSLFGLFKSLQFQSRIEALWIKQALDQAWQESDILLNENSL